MEWQAKTAATKNISLFIVSSFKVKYGANIQISFFFLPIFATEKTLNQFIMGLLSSLFGKSKSDANEQEKQDKKNFDILKYDGIRARNMGKLPYAIKCFEEAVALQEEKETLGLLASAYLQANRTEDARITLDRLIAQDETNVQALLSLASVCYIQEDYEGMEKASQKAIALDEKNAQAYYLAARAARGLKNDLQAIVMLTKAIVLHERLSSKPGHFFHPGRWLSGWLSPYLHSPLVYSNAGQRQQGLYVCLILGNQPVKGNARILRAVSLKICTGQ
jgi:tetratricopeptide (TPR) repeat protein